MKKIMFLCHGNICRSPMAEFVMKELVSKSGKAIEVDSAAVSDEEWGNPIYPPAKRKLIEHNIPLGEHAAHKITPSEFEQYDLILLMDQSNIRWLTRIVGEDKVNNSGKVYKLMAFASQEGWPSKPLVAPDVADPWYTGDFEVTYKDVFKACQKLIDIL